MNSPIPKANKPPHFIIGCALLRNRAKPPTLIVTRLIVIPIPMTGDTGNSFNCYLRHDYALSLVDSSSTRPSKPGYFTGKL
jgi:hypothetical protein